MFVCVPFIVQSLVACRQTKEPKWKLSFQFHNTSHLHIHHVCFFPIQPPCELRSSGSLSSQTHMCVSSADNGGCFNKTKCDNNENRLEAAAADRFGAVRLGIWVGNARDFDPGHPSLEGRQKIFSTFFHFIVVAIHRFIADTTTQPLWKE